jgi:hypothetical protein
MATLYPAKVVAPTAGLTFTGGPVTLPNPTVPQQNFTNFVSFSGANDWNPTAAQLIGTIVHVSSGTNSSLYTFNLPSASSMFAALGGIVGATCSFGLWAVWSFNMYAPTGASLWGCTIGNANGVSQGVASGGSVSSVVFNTAQQTSGTGFLFPNGAFYQITIRMVSSTSYNAYIK